MFYVISYCWNNQSRCILCYGLCVCVANVGSIVAKRLDGSSCFFERVRAWAPGGPGPPSVINRTLLSSCMILLLRLCTVKTNDTGTACLYQSWLVIDSPSQHWEIVRQTVNLGTTSSIVWYHSIRPPDHETTYCIYTTITSGRTRLGGIREHIRVAAPTSGCDMPCAVIIYQSCV